MVYGKVFLEGPEKGECGKWCYSAKLTKGSPRREPKWYLASSKAAAGGKPKNSIRLSGKQTTTKSGIAIDFCLNPVDHKPGTYWVVVRRYQIPGENWHWSRETIDYHPEVDAVLHLDLDGNAEYNVGAVPCESPLILTPLEQSCVHEYRVRVRRVHDGAEVGPEVWLTGWQGGMPVPEIDLRELAAQNGFDFVPGQCYKADVFARTKLNGGPYSSTGKVFCIDCCC